MQNIISYIKENLKELYSDSEIISLTNIILQFVTGQSSSSILFDKSKKITLKEEQIIRNIVLRLRNFEPIQYILGETEFYGIKFCVDKNVLIPRPETEELVELIIRENDRENLKILDIGTGSGAIAITLQKKLKSSVVTGWDISSGAVEIARKNAIVNNSSANFFEVDVLSDYPQKEQFDIIVSNPPYVLESEKKEMQHNVLDYEPHTALFVPDDDSLLFYERIADISHVILKQGGMLYFEINPLKSKELIVMLEEKEFSDVAIVKDISGKERILRTKK